MTKLAPPITQTTQRHILLVLAVVLLPHLLFQPPQISLWLALGFAWQTLYLQGRVPAVPRWMRWLLLAGGMGLVWVSHHTLIGRDGGVSFVLMLTALKLMEIHNQRDARISALLGLFLLFTVFLFDQSPFTALWALFSLAMLLGLLHDLSHGGEPQALKHSLRASLKPMLWSLSLALALFVLVPRPSAPLFGVPQPSVARTGLSDELQPGNITQLARSPELAFRATFTGAEPKMNQLYWRGPVFWGYDGQRWERLPPELALMNPQQKARSIQPQGEVLRYDLMLEASNSTILPALDRPLEAPANAALLRDASLRFRLPQDQRQLIVLQGDPLAKLDVDLPEDLRRLALQLPEADNPLLRDLGASWATLEPQARIQRGLELFNRQNFRYTLEPPPLGEQDGMDDFLFNTRAGFCEHYATSFVLLMRAAGLPARVVTGYQGGERHPEGYWIVRQGDAHAWAEVWLAGEGWVRIDPTASIAPERIERGASALLAGDNAQQLPAALRRDFGLLHRLRLSWDGVESRWNRWVLGFDASDQQRLLAALGWVGEQNLALWGLAILSTLLAFALLKAVQRWRARPKLSVQQRLWRDLQTMLQHHGIALYANESPRALQQRLRRQQPALHEAADWIEDYLRYCYAAHPDIHAGQLRTRLDRLASSMKMPKKVAVNH